MDESILSESEIKTLEFGHKVTSRLLVFDVSTIQGKFDHFQVTVRSDDDTQECLLYVSNDCSSVVNMDPRAVNVRKSAGSALHLTFTTFGRITLTRASKPQLSTGRWYIGVFLKEDQSKDLKSVTKTVQVSVGFAGVINRGDFATPVALLILVSVLGGVVIAVFADFFLNPEFEHQFIHNLRKYVHSREFKISKGRTDNVEMGNVERDKVEMDNVERDKVEMDNVQIDNVDMGNVEEDLDEASPRSSSNGPNRVPTGSICLHHDQDSGVPYDDDVANLRIPKYWPGFKNWGRVMIDWFHGDERSYAYTTAIVAFSLLTGAIQFIVSNWRDMIDSGNRDICYYNEGCYRTTPGMDIPFNLITSNLTYIIHGLILALSISLREATCRANERSSNVAVRKESFSIMYAFAWSVVVQGIFSSFYHVCPSRMTFQFDSAFMFVICALVLVAAYNAHVDKSRRQQGTEEGSRKKQVYDVKLFLFVVIPLLLLNYMGSIRDTDGFLLLPDALFYFSSIFWITCMFSWVFRRLMMPWKPRPEPAFWCKFGWLCALFPVVMLFIGLYTVSLQEDWSTFFLFTCLAAVMCTVVGYGVIVCSQRVYVHVTRIQGVTAHERRELIWKMYLQWPIVNLHVILYAVGTVICWLIALHFFLNRPVTDKVNVASKSREFNAECSLWEFFDDHDLWHILSSFALLSTAYVIIWCIG